MYIITVITVDYLYEYTVQMRWYAKYWDVELFKIMREPPSRNESLAY